MVKLTKIYTRMGDEGSTMLGSGEMVMKFDPRVTAYGEVDEANATIGVAIAAMAASDCQDRDALSRELLSIQNDLFDVGADLCVPIAPDEKPGDKLRITQAKVDELEQSIDRWNETLQSLNSFILPGGSPSSAAIHVARTVVRRAERATTHLLSTDPKTTNRLAQVYLNRLSDELFVIARIANDRGEKDVLWKPGGEKSPE